MSEILTLVTDDQGEFRDRPRFPADSSKIVSGIPGAVHSIPAGRSWDDWFDGPVVSGDFMTTREQPADQRREAL